MTTQNKKKLTNGQQALQTYTTSIFLSNQKALKNKADALIVMTLSKTISSTDPIKTI